MSYVERGTVGPTVIVSREPDRSGNYVCNGTNDDVEIQLALNRLTSGRTWKEKILLKGNFTIGSKLIVPSYAIIETHGALTLAAGVNDHMFSVNTKTDVDFIFGEYDGNKAGQTAGSVVYIINSDRISVQDIKIVDADDSGIEIAGSSSEIIISNDIIGTPDYGGIYTYQSGGNDPSNIKVDNCYFYGSSLDNVKLLNANRVMISNCGSYQGGCGFHTHSGATDIDIVNCWGNDCQTYENFLIQGSRALISNCISYDSADNGFGFGHETTPTIYDVQIQNCIAHTNQRDGIGFSHVTRGAAMGNILYNNNLDTGLVRGGIRIRGDSTELRIIGNRCFDDQGVKTQDYGIIEIDASDYNIIRDNDLRGNATGGLSLLGANTTAFQNRVDGTSTIGGNVIIPYIFTGSLDVLAALGDHPVITMADGVTTNVYDRVILPPDFQQLISAQVIACQTTTAGPPNMRWQIDTDFGRICAGQNYNQHSDSIGATDTPLDQNQLECIDISAALTDIAADDIIGFNFARIGGHANDTVNAAVYYMGIRLRYI